MRFFIRASESDGRPQAEEGYKEKRSFREVILQDVLPFYLSIGLDEEHFWSSTPKELEPYMKAYEIQQERIDYNNYTLGLYVYSAFGAVLGAAFGNKKAKYVEEPFSISAKNKKELENMDEETKMKYVRQLFGQLGTMQKSFEAEKKRKDLIEELKTSYNFKEG